MTGRGPVCLQGGAEFGPGCEELDALLLEAVEVDGPVVLLPAAGAPGQEYDAAGRRGLEHLRGLLDFGRHRPDGVVVAPDPREDLDAAVAAVGGASVVWLPGGSPARLLEALVDPRPGYPATTRLGAAVLARGADGAGLVGASAGAMVLADHVALPDRREGRRLPTGRGLGVVRGCVVPHWGAGSSPGWVPALVDGLPDGTALWGLGECSGLVVHAGVLRAAGPGPVVRVGVDGSTVAVGPHDLVDLVG